MQAPLGSRCSASRIAARLTNKSDEQITARLSLNLIIHIRRAPPPPKASAHRARDQIAGGSSDGKTAPTRPSVMAQHSQEEHCSGLCAIDDARQQTQEEGSQDLAEVEDIVNETVIMGGCGAKANASQVRSSWPNSLIVMLFHMLIMCCTERINCCRTRPRWRYLFQH